MVDRSGWTIQEWYLHCPTHEYSRAFDRTARLLEAADGPALVVVSSMMHAVEFLKRCQRPLDFAGTASFDAEAFVAQARDWAWGPIRAAALDRGPVRYAAFAWAEPEQSTTVELARLLRDRALPDAALAMVTSSTLRRGLPAWQIEPHPAHAPMNPGAAMAWLRVAGWRIEGIVAYHGPRSLLWGYLQRLVGALGRSDWADRCRLAMWSHYEEAGWLWPLAPLALVCGRAA